MDELKVDESIGKFARVTSEELIQELSASTQHLILSIPVGQVSPIYIYDIPQFVLPDPNLWQLCDGGIITNENSILYNPNTPDDLTGEIDETLVNRVPDLTDRYIRMSQNYGEDGQFGGLNYVDLSHNHSGYTGYWDDDEKRGEGGDDDLNEPRYPHRHTIDKDLIGEIDVEPPFIGIKFYMRIL